jgi:prepilin-type N-terminal cleavage/methylation domain-containing protein
LSRAELKEQRFPYPDNMKQTQRGFTLIELLLVVTILSLLAVSVFVALNPSQRLMDTKNARRAQDVETVLTAIHQFIIDNKGALPTNMPAANTEVQLGTAGTGCAIVTGGCGVAEDACVNLLTGATNLSAYLKSVPIDPSGGTTYDATKTGYSVMVDTNGIVTVRACGADNSQIIYAAR